MRQTMSRPEIAHVLETRGSLMGGEKISGMAPSSASADAVERVEPQGPSVVDDAGLAGGLARVPP